MRNEEEEGSAKVSNEKKFRKLKAVKRKFPIFAAFIKSVAAMWTNGVKNTEVCNKRRNDL